VALAKQLRDERLGGLANLRDLDPKLALPGLQMPGTKPVALARRPVRPPLVTRATQPRVELLLDRPRWMINRAPIRASSESILCGSSTTLLPNSLSMLASISADGSTVRLTA
jgi:hypothetical protein